MFGLLCCLFIITQYQPISCQYFWLSNKRPIRIDWVEYNHHGEFPIRYLHALLIYHIFLTGMDTTKSLPLGNHSIYMPQWVIELRKNAIKLMTRVYLIHTYTINNWSLGHTRYHCDKNVINYSQYRVSNNRIFGNSQQSNRLSNLCKTLLSEFCSLPSIKANEDDKLQEKRIHLKILFHSLDIPITCDPLYLFHFNCKAVDPPVFVLVLFWMFCLASVELSWWAVALNKRYMFNHVHVNVSLRLFAGLLLVNREYTAVVSVISILNLFIARRSFFWV